MDETRTMEQMNKERMAPPLTGGGEAVQKKNMRKYRQLYRFLIKIGIIAAVVVILWLFVARVDILHTNDMYPALQDGQLVIISKVTPLMDDQVVLYLTENGEKHYGRIMGLPGQEIEVREDTGVAIDGNVIYQTVPYQTPPGTIEYPYLTPENSYFILNDYRELETDSRTYGAIPRENIIGVVIFTMQYRGI